MSKKLRLTSITLETKGGKEIELTIDEARELHKQLHELFGTKERIFPPAPVIIERDRWAPPYWRYPPTWCGDTMAKFGSVEGGPALTCSFSAVDEGAAAMAG